ncbi:MAG TPA: aldo/keto reductase [Holophagaceae bacterium]|nr:aldo/keto reductase [Holophagaceae bacterium]
MDPSPIGLGTYLGEASDAADAAYAEAALAFHNAGGNVFDTAANYRFGRSERALGRAFASLDRAGFFVSTKAGYLPMGDGATEEDARQWFERTLLKPGILGPEDVIDGCHAMTPRYLDHQLEVSRRALGVATVDLFHLHNPEQQRPRLGPRRFDDAILAAFEACEGFRQAGRIGTYGVATWNGFRVAPDRPDHLSLERLLELAERAGGESHGFRWVQLPLNLALPEAFLAPTQRFGGRAMPLLEAAAAAGIRVQTSASIMQARILGELGGQLEELADLFPGCRTAAQVGLQFTRSCPGVTTALCGMGRAAHAQENAEVMALPAVPADRLRGLFR